MKTEVLRCNTILYCNQWKKTVDFYEHRLGLPVLLRKEWFVEFRLAENGALSAADAGRTSISPSGGRGITISLKTADAEAAREELITAGLDPGPLGRSWGSPAFFITDPEGNRLEIWS